MAAGMLRVFNTAEVSYANAYPQMGFACSLAALGPGKDSKPSAQHAGYIDPASASGMRDGYTFAVVNCTGTPADQYQIVAVPSDPSNRTFCTDQTAVIRYAIGSDPQGCLEAGQPL